MNSPAPVLEVQNLSKSYGLLQACHDISFEVAAGETVGLLGQNGAGKSTVMNIIGGITVPDQGEVRVNGTRITPGDPLQANRLGVGIVHQHYSLVPSLAVWENIVLGEKGKVDKDVSIERIREISGNYGLDIDPLARISGLSAGEKQRVEIIKCLRRDPRVMLLDEPTSVLTLQESRQLFGLLRELVEGDGRALVLVSHRLQEVMQATDRVLVLRSGRTVAHSITRETTPQLLATEMVGREVRLGMDTAALGATATEDGPLGSGGAVPVALDPSERGTALLRLRGVTVLDGDRRPVLDGIDLEAFSGEIVGIAGVEGNGQSELADVVAGLVTVASGALELDGTPVSFRRGAPPEIGIVPPDRHDSGCVLGMSIAENLALGRFGEISRNGVIRRTKLRERAEQLVEQFDVKVSTVDMPMWSLSGGNQQKLVLARELARNPRVLLAAYPTRGLDVGAMEFLWDRLRKAAADGCAVVLISTELEEILALSDRVAVLHKGKIVGDMRRSEVDMERLGMMMGGDVA